MLFLDIIYLHSLLVPNDQPLPYPGAHDWLHSTPPSKPKEEAMGPPPPPMPEEEVQPSLKDWLDCPGTSNCHPVDTPIVAIEVILSKPSHNFHTCCTMCIHMLQCNFLHVFIYSTSYVVVSFPTCVSDPILYCANIYVYIYMQFPMFDIAYIILL